MANAAAFLLLVLSTLSGFAGDRPDGRETREQVVAVRS